MAALKWLVILICSVVALGAAGVTGKEALALRGESSAAASVVVPKVALRALPKPYVASASATPAAPAPVAAPAAAPSPAAAEPARDAGVAAAAAAEPSPNKPPPPVAAPAQPVAQPPAAPAPVAKPPSPAPAPPSDGVLNLKASDTADVFVDGKRVGSSPAMGVKVKVGPHKVRFDCYDAAGNTVAGAVQNVTAAADKPVDLSFTCPPSE